MKKISLFLIIGILFVSCGQKDEGAVWKGTITEKDGVTVIHNPREPMYEGRIITFEEELSIGVRKGDENYMFNNFSDLAVDSEGNIYALDSEDCVIKVYDKNGNFLRKFGKKGQGPGEFEVSQNIQLSREEKVIIFDFRSSRLVEYSKNGIFLKNVIFPIRLQFTSMDSARNIYGILLDPKGEGIADWKLIKYSFPYKHKEPHTITSIPASIKIQPITYIRHILYKDNGLAWAVTSEYTLHICDKNEKEKRRIIKDYVPNPITNEYKEDYKKYNPGENPKFEKYYHPIGLIRCDEKGNIFIRTNEKDNLNGRYYDVFNKEGYFLGKTEVPHYPELFKNGKLYTIHFDEEGYQFIKRYKITWYH